MPELEHDRRLIRSMALMHEGNARAHLKRARHTLLEPLEHEEGGEGSTRAPWSQHDMLAASSFAIAASYWSLISPQRSIELYRTSSRSYRAMGHQYWIVLAVASADKDEISEVNSGFKGSYNPSAQSLAFEILANEVSRGIDHNVRAEQLESQWRHMGNLPVGRLGIPLDQYVRCARAMREAQTRPRLNERRAKDQMDPFWAEAASYVHRAAEVLRNARHDQFHWSRLQSAILPAEPEAVAMITAMATISHRVFDVPISEIHDLDQQGRLLVDVGEDIWRASKRHERNGDDDIAQ